MCSGKLAAETCKPLNASAQSNALRIKITHTQPNAGSFYVHVKAGPWKQSMTDSFIPGWEAVGG